MDPYKARQDVIQKMLIEELAARSHNSDICDSENDGSYTSGDVYVPSEHSDEEESDHASTPETVSDGDNLTVSGNSDAGSETDGDYEAENGQIWNKLTPRVSRHRKHNIVIGKPGLTAYSENISSLAVTLKLFITNDILNDICHHNNSEGSSQIPQFPYNCEERWRKRAWKVLYLSNSYALFRLTIN
jgi:hypothetical protein